MKYISTRGKAPVLSFEDVVIAGLASDGGLYVPESVPTFGKDEIASFKGLSYEELMLKIITPFIEDEIPQSILQDIIKESYLQFRDADIAPVKKIAENEYLLELFHGPTMAFKDFALQFLGRIFDYILTKRNQDVVIVGATSGDTGSAAIEGCRHSKHVQIYIMHPHNRVSDVQRKQMTTVLADNVYNIALEGNFDDCQHIVKELFADQGFLSGQALVAVNSINWCRIMAQIVYYFYAGLKLGSPEKEMIFSVPTGNFGDIFAGFLAKKMGLPIKQLIVATNKNDILHRFFESNDYSRGGLEKTLSPSMDIQVSSNFERYLFYLYNQDAQRIDEIMKRFKAGEGISVEVDKLAEAKKLFSSLSIDDDATCQTIRQVFDESGEIIDPHTATGVRAARDKAVKGSNPIITIATAHPAKFPEAIEKSGVDEAKLPECLYGLMAAEERYEVLANDIDTVKEFIVSGKKCNEQTGA
ncbi:MAG: threonine synthase [Rickettsiales bacterium]|nr:threonine synthase [Pseudomonadota bacterium]MDA0965577.1 threonine synthase [Pseudomonadota bacterium]MDG4542901.1 threonine synthase [Rickettsiales bacterium]MDG4544651.1 threonine synthase [Rickettsiales bacterium]MDG4546773.1 threonine synthase [Rickettsiales bacterium]